MLRYNAWISNHYRFLNRTAWERRLGAGVETRVIDVVATDDQDAAKRKITPVYHALVKTLCRAVTRGTTIEVIHERVSKFTKNQTSSIPSSWIWLIISYLLCLWPTWWAACEVNADDKPGFYDQSVPCTKLKDQAAPQAILNEMSPDGLHGSPWKIKSRRRRGLRHHISTGSHLSRPTGKTALIGVTRMTTRTLGTIEGKEVCKRSSRRMCISREVLTTRIIVS